MHSFKSKTILKTRKTFVLTVLSVYLPTTVVKLVEPVPVCVNCYYFWTLIFYVLEGKKVM